MAIKYSYKKTQKGDYLIRDQADRQLARVADESEAIRWIADKCAADAADSEYRADVQRDQTAFNDTVPDLNRLQIRWQNWRNWFYNELVHEERSVASRQRALDMKFDQHHSSPSYHKHQEHLTEDLAEVTRARDLYDDQIVPLDTRLKNARLVHYADELELILNEAEPLIERMDSFFMAVARPEEYKRPVGRPPAAGSSRQVRISATVPPELKAWLESRGDVSIQIRALIEQAMRDA